MKRFVALLCIMVLLCMAVFSSNVFAYSEDEHLKEQVITDDTRSGEDGYISSLHIGPNVNHSGPTRQYNKDRFKVRFEYAYGLDFTYSYSLTYKVRLYRKPFLIGTFINEQNMIFTANNQTRTTYHGNQGAGKYYWDFKADYNSGIDCDTVLLQSY